MKSMTGFGFAAGGSKDCRIEVSVKCVNSRFMDVRLYTSPFYFSMEPALKSLILNSCSRGQWVARVDRFPSKPPSSFSVSKNEKQARQWQQLYGKLSRELGIKNDLSASHLARLEGVIGVVEKPSPLSPAEKSRVTLAFKKALRFCLREKSREGLALKKDVLTHLTQLRGVLRKIRQISRKEIQRAAVRYKRETQWEEGSLDSMELFDINEELVRLEAHVKNCAALTGRSNGPVGKKLDFYTQEILREINTIGSKSPSADLTAQVVEGKCALEKIKEQVQNIE